MSFWQSMSGAPIDGSAEHSHAGSFKVIPDGTTAPGVITQAKLVTFDDGNQIYQVTYKLVDGEFKGAIVRQKINCFDRDAKKRDRAVNMFMRLYNLCYFKPTHNGQPTDDDLLHLQNKVIGLKIQEWYQDGKEGNWISEIHKVDGDFITESGKKQEHTGYIATPQTNILDSAFSRNEPKKDINLDDIPF